MNKILQEYNLNLIKNLFNDDSELSLFEDGAQELIPALVYVYEPSSESIRIINKIPGPGSNQGSGELSNIRDLVYDEDLELFIKELQVYLSLKEGESHSCTLRYKNIENTWRFFRTQGLVLNRDKNGFPLSILFIAQDIHNEMGIEEEGKALKELFQETEQLLHFGTWSWHAYNDILEWSDGMYALLEYEREKTKPVTNDFYLSHIPEPERSTLKQIIKSALENNSEFEYHYPVMTATGKKKFVSTKGKSVFTGKGIVIKIIGVTRDITTQRKVHKDLLDYKQAILDKEKFLGSGSWEYDVATGKITWSEGKFRMHGIENFDFQQPEITIDYYRKLMGETEHNRLQQLLKEIFIDEEEHTWDYEIKIKGEKKVIESYARILKDDHDKPYKIIGASRDITRIREYEESLKRKIRELDRSNKELEEFAYIASHDLQEPIRKINTFSERLRDRAKNELSSDSILYLDKMLNSATNMRMLIDNLLEFSRTSRTNLPYDHCELESILKDSLSELELKFEETGATIVKSKLPAIEAICSQMQQTFNNLISNAIKFRKPGTPPVIKVTCVEVSFEEKEQNRLPTDLKYYKLTFEDNGIGFEPEYSGKIFQIFQRLHGKSEYPGSGIGLAIVKKIIDNHHGMIYAQSEPGKGATFIIYLPEKQP
ncbi:MAG: ATP-binding protein [Flavitalea sp.]